MEHIVRDYRQSDDQGLAVMWNESQVAWPTGFGGAVAYTQERIANEMKRRQALYHLVAEAGGRIVGYCWVSSYPKEPDACYVALVNAHPDYHGQGIGKALLLESIKRAIAGGYYRVDLNTWPSNIKAVPLYKKTGFFWVPDTMVHMQNYIPAVIGHPACRDFFSRHDWYATFKRALDQEPDEIKLGKRRTFPYRFEAGQEFVEVTFDMESRRIYRIETDKLSAGLVLDDPQVIAGRKHTVVIQTKDKCGTSLAVSWQRPSRKGITVNKFEQGQMEFTVDPELEVPEEDLPALSLRTKVTWGGRSFNLDAGIRPVQPVELEWQPAYPSMLGQKATSVDLRLKSNLAMPAEVNVTGRMAGHGLIKIAYRKMRIGAEGRAGTEVKILKAIGRLQEIGLKAIIKTESEKLATKTFLVPVFNINHGDRSVLWADEHDAIWETAALRIVARKKGGSIRIIDKATGGQTAYIESALGPPFWPSEFNTLACQVRLESSDALAVSAESQQNPGLRFDRVLRLVGERELELTHRVANGTKGRAEFQVNATIWPTTESPRSRKVVPLKDGCIEVGGANPFGGLTEELPKKPEDYAETWWAQEDGHNVTGIVWTNIQAMEFPSLVLEVGTVRPGQTKTTAPSYILTGPGDHTSVRKWYCQRVLGQRPDDYRRIEVEPRISVGWEPAVPFLTTYQRMEKVLRARNQSRQELPVQCQLEAPDAVKLEQERIDFPAVKLGNPGQAQVPLVLNDTEPATGTITVTSGIASFRQGFGLVPMGSDTNTVGIEAMDDQGLTAWRIDNGVSVFKVSPQFIGSLYSWQHQGREQLVSAFPAPGNFSWERPWYGGISPFVGDPQNWGQNLMIKEKYSAAAETAVGRHGLKWQGVKLVSQLTDKKLRGLTLEVRYLTLPQCPVLAIAYRMENTTDAFFHLTGECMGFLAPDGDNTTTVLHWDGARAERKALRGDKGWWAEADQWATAVNPKTGRSLTLALPGDRSRQSILIFDYGRDGGHFGQAMSLRLKARETVEYLAFWGIARTLESSKAFRHLADLKELP